MSQEHSPATLGALLSQIDRAHEVVSDLCNGKRKWTMSIPVSQDDPDIIIGNALQDAKEALTTRSETACRNGIPGCACATNAAPQPADRQGNDGARQSGESPQAAVAAASVPSARVCISMKDAKWLRERAERAHPEDAAMLNKAADVITPSHVAPNDDVIEILTHLCEQAEGMTHMLYPEDAAAMGVPCTERARAYLAAASAPSTTRQIKTIDYAITLLEIEGNAEKVLQYLREARDQHVLTLPSRELLREQIKADPDIESSTSAPSAMGTKSVERARDAFSLDATNLQHDLDEQTATAGLLAATVKVLNEELASLSELDSLFAKFDEAQPDYLTVYLTLPQHDFWAQVVEYLRKRRADGGKQTDG